jgi:uncharacterized protein YecE (DUF72 family)
MGTLFIGTSGFYYSKWAGIFYPEELRKDEWLKYFASKFNTVELNNTFYHIPRLSSVEGWKESIRDDFVFTFKVSKLITHNPELEFDQEILNKFLDSFGILKSSKQKHLLLFQLPHSTKQNIFNLKKLLDSLPQHFRYAFEFRNKSWFESDVLELLKKHNATIVFSNSPLKYNGEPAWPQVDFETADFSYFRLHGSKRLYESKYTEEELEDYKNLIKLKLEKGLDVYVYFNNTMEVHAVDNAFELKELLL